MRELGRGADGKYTGRAAAEWRISSFGKDTTRFEGMKQKRVALIRLMRVDRLCSILRRSPPLETTALLVAPFHTVVDGGVQHLGGGFFG